MRESHLAVVSIFLISDDTGLLLLLLLFVTLLFRVFTIIYTNHVSRVYHNAAIS